ncbi:AAA family ATPase [Deinococcus sp. Arct2-2]|uniref:AAA family ATPase n=1 Tax=Deinococcus sp. Arct2-2 TaxID=2568653 RepID=UPI0010A560A4|nr:AAA family ATPase [Deinococcus sp. Arct2-2]THF71450.1 AAA family ATPase [Deinococcus sp. Arct2-2]
MTSRSPTNTRPEPSVFATVFAQFKIPYDALAQLPAEQQRTLDMVAVGADWISDSVGALLSPVLPLAVPGAAPSGRRNAEQLVEFPWADQSTRAEAAAMAQVHLLVCDVISDSPRGPDAVLRFSGHVADEQGGAWIMFAPAPRPLLLAAELCARQSVLGSLTKTRVLAYRAVPFYEHVLSLEALLRFLPKKRQVALVKDVQVYEHHLERRGADFWHHCQLRAAHNESSGPGQHTQPLGSSLISELFLHALSGPSLPYAHLDGQPPPRPSMDARNFLEGLLRPPKPKVPEPTKPEPTKPVSPHTGDDTTGSGSPVILPIITEPSPPPALAPPAETEPEIRVEPEPLKPLPVNPPPTLWDSLQGRLVIDREVLDTARVALSLARPLLLEGAPGTGKTLLATLLAEAFCGPGNFTLVTADARWTSSDVLGGLKVAPGDSLRYLFQPGSVTRAAQRHHDSMQNSGRPHALIIDEFNRAHQDEAFGRLLTLLDPEYRSRMPLVSEADGAPEAVYLPLDFLLIATMNDADVGRLHEIGAALTRRFVTLPLTVPREERAFLEQTRPQVDKARLNALYAFVGSGQPSEDRAAKRLRAYVTVGTHFMCEALALTGAGLSLDDALKTLTYPHVAGLSRDTLTALHRTAQQVELPHLAAQLQTAGEAAPF